MEWEKSSFDSKCFGGVSTDMVTYVGAAIPCLGICKGDKLTKVQVKIASTLCSLLSSTDLNSLVIPTCLIEAWDDKNKTVLSVFQFLLDELCLVKADITEINNALANFNPQICLVYPSTNAPCTAAQCLPLLTHLQNLLDMIGVLQGQVVNLQNQIDNL